MRCLLLVMLILGGSLVNSCCGKPTIDYTVEPVIMKKRPITFNYWYTGPSFGCVGPPGWVGDASLYTEPTKVEIPILDLPLHQSGCWYGLYLSQ